MNCIPVPCAPSRTEIGNFPPPRPWKRSQETLAAGEGNLKCPKSQRGVLVHALARRSPHTWMFVKQGFIRYGTGVAGRYRGAAQA